VLAAAVDDARASAPGALAYFDLRRRDFVTVATLAGVEPSEALKAVKRPAAASSSGPPRVSAGHLSPRAKASKSAFAGAKVLVSC